jgi:hypothetical protein
MDPIPPPDTNAPKAPSRHHAHRTEWQWARDDAAEQQRDSARGDRKGA